MENPRYNVTIAWHPLIPSGHQHVLVGGITQSYTTNTYSGNYYVASMHEAKLFATGSSYTQALSNLMILATASSFQNPGDSPYSDMNTW